MLTWSGSVTTADLDPWVGTWTVASEEGRTCYPGGAVRWGRSRMLPQENGTLRHGVEHSNDFGRTWSHASTTVATRVATANRPEEVSDPSEATGG